LTFDPLVAKPFFTELDFESVPDEESLALLARVKHHLQGLRAVAMCVLAKLLRRGLVHELTALKELRALSKDLARLPNAFLDDSSKQLGVLLPHSEVL
jgi:hypothetical protein